MRYRTQEALEAAIKQDCKPAQLAKVNALQVGGWKIQSAKSYPVPNRDGARESHGYFWMPVFMSADQGRFMAVFPDGTTQAKTHGTRTISYKFPWARGVQVAA